METVGLVTLVPKGKLYNNSGMIFDRDLYVLDAEPQVMAMARRLFPSGNSAASNGKYTHRVMIFPISNNTGKDLHWFAQRFALEFKDGAAERVQAGADKYDEIQREMATLTAEPVINYSPEDLVPAVELRPHQKIFVNLQKKLKKVLLADKLGMGKTFSALGCLSDKANRPALIITPPSLCLQWEREVARLYPGITTHVIRGIRPYDLPLAEVYITSYNRLSYWQDTLVPMDRATVIMDEVHELRHTGTAKRDTATVLTAKADNVVSLSATPIYNYGGETWSVVDATRKDSLGTYMDFASEWCFDMKVREPELLNKHLKINGLMVRRTPAELGMTFGEAQRHVVTIDADLDSLRKLENTMKKLAISVLSNQIGGDNSSDDARKEFDYKLRMATGVAKAKSVCEFVKMLILQGEKVLLAGWHREVYDIYMKELKDHWPVMVTGSESPATKQKNIDRFISDPMCKVLIISHASGAGIDGLQRVSSTVVFGELAWSSRVMDQIVGRVDRDGQENQCNAYFLTVSDGSDPSLMSIIQTKNSQHQGIIEGTTDAAQIFDTEEAQSKKRIEEMAKAYLEGIGEALPEPVPEEGLAGEVARLLRKVKVLDSSNEEQIQLSLHNILKAADLGGAIVHREYKLSKKSRLDFLIERGEERVVIEVKKGSDQKAAVYRQVRRYVEEAQISALVLFAPWFGIANFKVENTPIIIADYTSSGVL